MEIGDLYLAEVPFHNRPGSKQRIVLIVKILNDAEIVVLESRGKPHDNLTLIGVVDFTRRGYLKKYVGQSYFYSENVNVLPATAFKKGIARLTPPDFKEFFEKIKELIEKFEKE